MAQEFVESSTGRLRVGDLLALETSILNVLCLTINTAGSELKYQILDSLAEADFYFPISRSIFNVLTEMHQRGDFVVLGNLEEELRKRSESPPEGFFLDDLFRGELPAAQKLTQWIDQAKERSGSGLSPIPDAAAVAASDEPPTRARATKTPPPAQASTTQVRAAAEARKIVANAARRQSKSNPVVLTSEADEWGDYFTQLAAKQGKTFETGFAGFDETVGGLGPGLILVLDADADRVCGFLKQFADQVAEHSKLSCLYLSFERPKATLRVRTLSRLSGVSAQDIEKGRLKKDSRDWLKVEESGRQAAEWMKRLYVAEADPGTGVGLVRDMCQRLLSTNGEPTCLLVVDSLERLGAGSESLRSVIAELKKLAESLDVLVMAATSSGALLTDRSVNLTAVIRDGEGSIVELEVLRGGDTQSITLRFEYLRSIHRFIEQPQRTTKKA